MKKMFAVLLSVLLLFASMVSSLSATRPPNALPIEKIIEKLVVLNYLSKGVHSDDEIVAAIQAFEEDEDITEEGTLFIDEIQTRAIVRMFQKVDGGEPIVWVPVYGGKRYHPVEETCRMYMPEHVSLSAARELGYTSCGTCKTDANLPIAVLVGYR